MDRSAWWATIHGVTRVGHNVATKPPDFPGGSDGEESACNAGDPGSILGQEDLLEEETATHSGILAWEIPWT